MAYAISSELVGLEFPATEVEWSDRDTMLYALAVGARPEGELDFVYENRGPKVLPTFGVVPSLTSLSAAIGQVQMNPLMILHGEQGITLHRAIPARCKGSAVPKIVEVWDKGKAAVIGLETVFSDKDGPIFTTRATLFIQGAGGFGGERGPSSEATRIAVPDRAADHVVEQNTHEEQAALYRLCGDRNPIHIDSQMAMLTGAPKAFLHGLCTYGFAGRALLQKLCAGDPARFKAMVGRFSDKVFPGDTIITRIWETAPGEAVFTVETQKGNVVIANARVSFAV